jgi:hypothetical protein
MYSSDGVRIAFCIIETQHFDMRRGKKSALPAGLGAWYRNGQAGLLIPSATSYDPRFDD